MVLAEKKVTTSEQVRQLWDTNMKVKDIAKELGIRYQFAYNVVQAYLVEQSLAIEKRAAAASEPKLQLVQPPVQPIVQASTPAPAPAPIIIPVVVTQPSPAPQTLNIRPFGQPVGNWKTPDEVVQPAASSTRSVLDRLLRR